MYQRREAFLKYIKVGIMAEDCKSKVGHYVYISPLKSNIKLPDIVLEDVRLEDFLDGHKLK